MPEDAYWSFEAAKTWPKCASPRCLIRVPPPARHCPPHRAEIEAAAAERRTARATLLSRQIRLIAGMCARLTTDTGLADALADEERSRLAISLGYTTAAWQAWLLEHETETEETQT